MTDWAAFYDAVAQRPPHETVVGALDRFGGPGSAVDLGCGDGRDTVEMLRRGWSVLAIDAEAEAIRRLAERAAGAQGLDTLVAPFDEARWPEADLVNAGFSLPFCPPRQFEGVWTRIVASIRPGGRFSGQLFGEGDEWAGEKDMTFHSRAQALALLNGFDLERFDEVDEDGKTATGEPKHWHVFHLIARRPTAEPS